VADIRSKPAFSQASTLASTMNVECVGLNL
jgi:hypothetical protein